MRDLQEAVEAAVQADCEFVSPLFLGSDPEETKQRWADEARRHLEAAYPLIRKTVAAEIADDILNQPGTVAERKVVAAYIRSKYDA